VFLLEMSPEGGWVLLAKCGIDWVRFLSKGLEGHLAYHHHEKDYSHRKNVRLLIRVALVLDDLWGLVPSGAHRALLPPRGVVLSDAKAKISNLKL
jgi:hypothetical protein